METTTPNNNYTIKHRFVNFCLIIIICYNLQIYSNTPFCRELNKNVEDDIITFINFLEEIKKDYSNGCAQLCTALNKFAKHYKAAKLKSILQLVSFLYDINRKLDLAVNIRSGSMIRVQVESVK
ncbi:unnamed protein product [Rhizophagus irregularis]|uniref:Uncharacterized protein n=1 Tax=Rhizophagus irregularis TaxID=588596 RepID=A0A915Z735_9GLOM|nr:unnamed protein product [Rhizophagus irregularis]CAB5365350.1 unnamed protein product [Rhizophagus irregularis]